MNLQSVFKTIRKKTADLTGKAGKPVRGADGSFGEMQNVREKWDLSEKDAYVKQHGRAGYMVRLTRGIFSDSVLCSGHCRDGSRCAEYGRGADQVRSLYGVHGRFACVESMPRSFQEAYQVPL
jgi:hypothetical protein